MSDVPDAVAKHLQHHVYEHLQPAYLRVDATGRLLVAGGDVRRYAAASLEVGQPVAGRLDCLEGLWPLGDQPLLLSCVASEGGCPADVHVFPGADGHWVLFLDAGEEAGRRQKLHQLHNELALLRGGGRSPGHHPPEAALAAELLAALDVLVLESHDGERCSIVGRIPNWSGTFIADAAQTRGNLRPWVRFPFLKNFLIDAEAFWAGGQPGSIKSGIWFELDDAGAEQALEATAVSLGDRRMLLVELLSVAYEERQRLIQTAREGKLHSHQLQRVGDKLARQADELTRSNAELQEFAYVASHDLRAPLRAINSLATWIEDDLGAEIPVGIAENLALLKDRGRRMDQLIDSLLAYARAGGTEARYAEVDLSELIRHVVFMLDPPEGFTICVPENGPNFTTARAPLEQVLQNLISNAIKYHDRPDGRVDVFVRSADEFLEIAVADDGPGIPPKHRERVFRMFQTLQSEEESKGTGMGLALVKRIVEQHGGTIELEAHEGRGATFRFSWPLSPPES